jgi:hypothetical protein
MALENEVLFRIPEDSLSPTTPQSKSKRGLRYVSLRWLRTKDHGRVLARCGTILAVVLAVWWLGLTGADAQILTRTSPQAKSTEAVSTPTPNNQQNQINDLQNRVDELYTIVQLLLAPIAILIGILSLGGALGVVFSLRDQRRLSQFHELAVSSEISSQRRTELSYSSFLEESQKTLTLVNQTLALAREATDQAAHTMERKAAASLASIETNARDLLEPLLDKGDFEGIVDSAEDRSNLETIAGELRAIEGYLLLQDIDLKPYSRFVKGMAQYLANDTTGALRTLRHAAQDPSVRELQLFAIYWDADLNIVLGRYAEADHVFRLGEENLSERSKERVEFDRMSDDAKFFILAADRVNADPLERFNAVAPLLIDLEKVSDHAHAEDSDARTRTTREVADTRGDLLSWIAYQSDRLYEPLAVEDVLDARRLNNELGSRNETTREANVIRDDGTFSVKPIKEGKKLDNQSPGTIRAWALIQAQIIYEREHNEGTLDLALALGKAECEFMLRSSQDDDCIDAYKSVERKAIEQLGSHREQRKSVELADTVLICASRLLHLYRRRADLGEGEVRNEETEVKNAHLRVQESLAEMRDHKITINSPLQRRPLNRSQFAEEAKVIVDQSFRTPHA